MDLALQSGTVPIKLPFASVQDAPFVAGQSLGSIVEELWRRCVVTVSESERTKKAYPDDIPWNRFTVIRPTGSPGAKPNVDALAANYTGDTLVVKGGRGTPPRLTSPETKSSPSSAAMETSPLPARSPSANASSATSFIPTPSTPKSSPPVSRARSDSTPTWSTTPNPPLFHASSSPTSATPTQPSVAQVVLPPLSASASSYQPGSSNFNLTGSIGDVINSNVGTFLHSHFQGQTASVSESKSAEVRYADTHNSVPIAGKEHPVYEFVKGDPAFFQAFPTSRSRLIPVEFLLRGVELLKSVGRVRVEVPLGDEYGTGFIVADGVLMTNHHVLPTLARARKAFVAWDFNKSSGAGTSTGAESPLDPVALYEANLELDCAIVAFKQQRNVRPIIELHLDALDGIEKDPRTVAMGHPLGGHKQFAVDGGFQSFEDKWLVHNNDTLEGSSGTPVFNRAWRLLALHSRALPDYSQGHAVKHDGTPWTQGVDSHSTLKCLGNLSIPIDQIILWIVSLLVKYPNGSSKSLFLEQILKFCDPDVLRNKIDALTALESQPSDGSSLSKMEQF